MANTKKPEKPGWYWCKVASRDWTPVRVYSVEFGLRCNPSGGEELPVADPSLEWHHKRIKSPDEKGAKRGKNKS